MSKDKHYYTEQWWLGQIKAAEKWRYKHGHEDAWQRVTDYYNQNVEHPTHPNFNLIYVLANSLMPALMYQNPSVVNTPKRPAHAHWAKFFDGIGNVLIPEMGTDVIGEQLILQAFLHNTVGLQLGYDLPQDQAKDEATADLFPKIGFGWDNTRRQNRPYWSVIAPDKLLVAVGTTTMQNCRWFARKRSVAVRVLKLMASRGYSIRNIKATHTRKAAVDLDEEGCGGDYVVYWEIHDAEKAQVMWLSTAGKWLLPPMKDPMQFDGLPLEILSFNHNPKSIWGTPDSLYIESQHLEGNECRRDGRMQRKFSLIKFFYDPEKLNEESLEDLLSGQVAVGIPIKADMGKRVGDYVELFKPYATLETNEYQNQLLNDAQLLIGQGPNQQGQYATGRRTKYEASIVQERNLLKTGKRRAELANIFSKHIARINQLVQTHWTGQHLAPIIGVEGAIHWVQAAPTEFEAPHMNLITKVNVESMTPMNTEKKRGELTEMISAISSLPPTEETMAITMNLLKTFLSSYSWDTLSSTLPSVGKEESMQEFQQGQTAEATSQLNSNLSGLTTGASNVGTTE